MAIVLITTLRCNLLCAHCLHGGPDQRSDFPLDLLPRLLIEAKSFHGQHVALTGGEPGLHPAFGQMIEIVVGAGYTWSFVSNGMTLEPYSTLLEEYGQQLTGVTLSLEQVLPAAARVSEGRFWTVSDLMMVVEQWYDVTYQDAGSYRNMFKRCGFSYHRAEKRYKSRSSEAAAAVFALRGYLLAFLLMPERGAASDTS